MDITPDKTMDEETIFKTPGSPVAEQPEIEGENDDDGDDGEEDLEDVIQEHPEEKVMTEDELRKIQKGDSINVLAQLRMKPEESFRMHIPLCRLVTMPMVRLALLSDTSKLEQDFAAGGYRDGAAVFYVSTTNEEGNTEEFTEAEMEKWDPIWREKNQIFSQKLEGKQELQFLKNFKFFICDGNHRSLAWMNFIGKHSKWHCNVDSIILDTKGKNEIVMQVMHDINK